MVGCLNRFLFIWHILMTSWAFPCAVTRQVTSPALGWDHVASQTGIGGTTTYQRYINVFIRNISNKTQTVEVNANLISSAFRFTGFINQIDYLSQVRWGEVTGIPNNTPALTNTLSTKTLSTTVTLSAGQDSTVYWVIVYWGPLPDNAFPWMRGAMDFKIGVCETAGAITASLYSHGMPTNMALMDPNHASNIVPIAMDVNSGKPF